MKSPPEDLVAAATSSANDDVFNTVDDDEFAAFDIEAAIISSLSGSSTTSLCTTLLQVQSHEFNSEDDDEFAALDHDSIIAEHSVDRIRVTATSISKKRKASDDLCTFNGDIRRATEAVTELRQSFNMASTITTTPSSINNDSIDNSSNQGINGDTIEAAKLDLVRVLRRTCGITRAEARAGGIFWDHD